MKPAHIPPTCRPGSSPQGPTPSRTSRSRCNTACDQILPQWLVDFGLPLTRTRIGPARSRFGLCQAYCVCMATVGHSRSSTRFGSKCPWSSPPSSWRQGQHEGSPGQEPHPPLTEETDSGGHVGPHNLPGRQRFFSEK